MRAILVGTLQAKGRIERLWGAMQKRLVAEFRLYVICLIAGIDDAKSDVSYSEFFETESLKDGLKALR